VSKPLGGLIKETQTGSEQGQSEQQQKVEQALPVTYTVKLPNGAKFTRLNPVDN
jgi:hypothetical protein